MPFIAPAIPLILAATAVAGVGLQAYGTAKAASAAKTSNEYQMQIVRQQQQQEELRRKAMELDNRRRQREAVRNAQKARSLALAAATNQGGDFGSGLQGGYGQISGQTGTNLLGLSQNLALGRANFDLSSGISSSRIGMAGASSDYGFAQGLTSLGGGLVNSMGAIGRLGGMFGTGYTQDSGASYYPGFDSTSAY